MAMADSARKLFDDDPASPSEEIVETVDQHPSSTAPSEDSGGSSPERADISLKLNPEAGVDSPADVEVPGFDSIELSDSPTDVPADQADLLLTTNLAVRA